MPSFLMLARVSSTTSGGNGWADLDCDRANGKSNFSLLLWH